jgi:CRISPR-associated endonuclease Csn1
MFDACEVDHILPYSRSFDDSTNNKVLVLASENRNKGNRTPFEYFGSNESGEKWHRFSEWVLGHKLLRKAKRDRLLRRSFDEAASADFKERQLNDTRYATRYFAQFVQRNLCFAPGADGELLKQPVRTPAGAFTAFMRHRWGLKKDRNEGDLHHAQDACVVAAASAALIKRVSDVSRRKELTQLSDGTLVDQLTGEVLGPEAMAALGERFPQPWDGFADELRARLEPKPREALGMRFAAYGELELAAVRPVWVSRAVKRLNKGALHEETVRSKKLHLGDERSSVRVPLQRLTLKMLEDVVGIEDGRNTALLEAIRKRLEVFRGDGKKAFGANQPAIHKPLRDGTPGPVVRALRIKSVQKGGVPVRGGVADQASMWRVDVFEKAGKFYLVPIYQSQRRKGLALPSRAATAGEERAKWTLVDESYRFCFSLHMNDGVTLHTSKMHIWGYFAGLNVSTASISILVHDRSSREGKDGVYSSLGVKVGVRTFEKWHVDVLGRRFRAKPEQRGELA